MNLTITPVNNNYINKKNTHFGMHKTTPEAAQTIAGLIGDKVVINLGNAEHIRKYLPERLRKYIPEITKKFENHFLTEKEAGNISWDARTLYDRTKQNLVKKALSAPNINPQDINKIAQNHLEEMSDITAASYMDAIFLEKNYQNVLLEMNEKITASKQKAIEQLKALGVVIE